MATLGGATTGWAIHVLKVLKGTWDGRERDAASDRQPHCGLATIIGDGFSPFRSLSARQMLED